MIPKHGYCIHCKVRGRNRPRNLCWRCYYTEEIRESYPSKTPKMDSPKSPGGDFCGTLPPPLLATDAMPGSEEKIRVMEERFLNSVSLWHTGDPVDSGRKITRRGWIYSYVGPQNGSDVERDRMAEEGRVVENRG